MKYKEATQYGNITVVQKFDYTWGVIDADGNEIVPFGKYDWIEGFDNGLSRVKIGKDPSYLRNNHNKWGIISADGEEVLPVQYDEVWKFFGKNRSTTTIVKDGVKSRFWLTNNDIPGDDDCEGYDDDEYAAEHYEEFAGTYAQDVAGFSDEDIYDVFDGQPDAYWNID